MAKRRKNKEGGSRGMAACKQQRRLHERKNDGRGNGRSKRKRQLKRRTEPVQESQIQEMDDFLQRKRKAPEGDDCQEENREANKKRAKASKNKKAQRYRAGRTSGSLPPNLLRLRNLIKTSPKRLSRGKKRKSKRRK